MAYKAFVSSTFEDLKQAPRHGSSRICVGPACTWTPWKIGLPTGQSRNRFQWTVSRDAICAFCWWRCAAVIVPKGAEHSITQMEYDEAIRRGLDVLVYMVDENAPWPRSFDELDSDPAMRPWREHLGTSHGVEFFTNDPDSVDVTHRRWHDG